MMRFPPMFMVVAVLAVLMVAFVSQPVAAATGTLDQQQTSIVGGLLLYYESASTFQFLSQTFTAGLTGPLTEVDLAIGWEGTAPNPNGDVTVEIHSGSPTGTLLGSSSLGPSYIPQFSGSAPDVFVAFAFSGVSVVAGSVYAIVITVSDAQYDPPHYVIANYYLSDSYGAGTAYYDDGSGWFDLNYDLAFKTYVAVPTFSLAQNGNDVSSISVPVCTEFDIEIWIRNIPEGYGVIGYSFHVSWDSGQQELIGYEHNHNGWDPSLFWVGATPSSPFNVAAGYPYNMTQPSSNPDPSPVEGDSLWLTFTLHCLGEGTSSISVSAVSLPLRFDTIYVFNQETDDLVSYPFASAQITCNQYQQRGPSGPRYVGGEVFTANKLAVLSPYLVLFSVVAVAAVLVRRRRI